MQNQYPLAVVDRNGVVWPWDGQEINEHLVNAGSRYLFDEDELETARAAYTATLKAQSNRRVVGGADPSKAPAKVKSPGTSKKVREAVLGATGDPILDTLN